jgi:high-affinity iron transporter
MKNIFAISVSATMFIILCMLGCTKSYDQDVESRRIVGLIDYIIGDYHLAVGSGKEIVSQEEWLEMKVFSASVQDLFVAYCSNIGKNTSKNRQDISQQMKQLQKLIYAKSLPSVIQKKAKFIKDKLLVDMNLSLIPEDQVNLSVGRKIFNNNCKSCHGFNGKGDTPIGQSLYPRPKDLLEQREHLSVFKVFNLLHTGIADTSMVSFAGVLSGKEMWDVSFYVLALPYLNYKNKKSFFDIEPRITLKDLTVLSDNELMSFVKQKWKYSKFHDVSRDEILSFLRVSSLGSVRNTKPVVQDSIDAINKAIKTLQNLSIERINLTRLEVERKLIDAYLNGFEGAEAFLITKDPVQVKLIERTFIELRSYDHLSQHFLEKLQFLLNQLQIASKSAGGLKKNIHFQASWWAESAASFTIIVREGVEAFLIIFALWSLVISLGAVRLKKWIHAGWLLALLCGVGTYWLMNVLFVASGAARELLEALCSGLAAILLFYTGYWLLSRTEKVAWDQFLQGKTKSAILENKKWTIFTVVFLAAYREAAETVLFYKALMSTASSMWSIIVGGFLGILCLLILCYCIKSLQVKFSITRFFRVTSLFMLALSVVLTGKAIFELIEAGYLTPYYIEYLPYFTVLGVYPIVQTLVPQIMLIVLGGVLFFVFSDRRKSRKSLHRV